MSQLLRWPAFDSNIPGYHMVPSGGGTPRYPARMSSTKGSMLFGVPELLFCMEHAETPILV